MDDYDRYYDKYLKYKDKYLKLQAQQGRGSKNSFFSQSIPSIGIPSISIWNSYSPDKYKLYFCNNNILKLLIKADAENLLTEKRLNEYLSIDYTQEYRCIAFEANDKIKTLDIVKSPETSCIAKKIYLTEREELQTIITMTKKENQEIEKIINDAAKIIEELEKSKAKAKTLDRELAQADQDNLSKNQATHSENTNKLAENKVIIEQIEAKLNDLPSDTQVLVTRLRNKEQTKDQVKDAIDDIATELGGKTGTDFPFPYIKESAQIPKNQKTYQASLYAAAKAEYNKRQKEQKDKLEAEKNSIIFPKEPEISSDKRLSWRLKNLSLEKSDIVLGDLIPTNDLQTSKDIFIDEKAVLVTRLNKFVKVIYPTFYPINCIALFAFNKEKQIYKLSVKGYYMGSQFTDLNYQPCTGVDKGQVLVGNE